MKNELQEVGKKASIFFIATIVGQLVAAIYGIIIARTVGDAIYGQYAYVLSTLSIVVIVSKLGFKDGLLKFVPKYKRQSRDNAAKEIVAFCIFVVAIFSFILMLIGITFSDTIENIILNREGYKGFFKIMVPSVFFICLQDTLLSVLRANKEIKTYSFFMKILIPINKIIIFFIILALYPNKSVNILILTLYASTTVVIILLFKELISSNLIKKQQGACSKVDYKEIVLFSLPLLFSGVVGTLMMNLDKYMIGYSLDDASVGVYQIAIQIVVMLDFSTLSVTSIYTPIISELYEGNETLKIKDTFKELSKWIFVIDLSIYGGMVLFGKEIVSLAGKDFSNAAIIIIIIGLGRVISSMFGTTSAINTMTGHPEYELKVNAFTVVINIILNIILIRRWGVNGAAIATSTSLVFAAIMRAILLYKDQKLYSFSQAFLKVVTIVALAILATVLFHRVLLLEGITRLLLEGVFYGLLLLIGIWISLLTNIQRKNIKKVLSRKK